MNKSQAELPNNLTFSHAYTYQYPKHWTIPSTIVYCSISIMILSGNGLVIASFCTNLKLRTKTYFFFVSLAAADLLIATVSIPMWIYLLVSQDYSNKALSKSYAFFDVMSGLSSILNLTAISLERWYAIAKPVKHRNLPKRRVIRTIIVAWFLSVVFSALACFNTNPRWMQIYMFLVTVFLFFCPMGIIAVAYWKIFRASGKIMNTRRDGNSFKKDLRNAMTIGIVIGVFVICWLPFFILVIITFTRCAEACSFLYDMRIVIIIKMMHYGNSAVNPIIYASRIPEFKRTFCRLINKMFTPRSKLHLPRESSLSIVRRSTRKTSATSVSNSTKRESTVPLYSDIFFISAV